MKELLLRAPVSQLDASMLPLVAKWSDPPTALQVLEVLDHCVHSSLASGFVVKVLDIEYGAAVEREGTTRESVEALATWRTAGTATVVERGK